MYTLASKWSVVTSGSSFICLHSACFDKVKGTETWLLPKHFIHWCFQNCLSFSGDEGQLCITTTLALKNTKRIITTPSRPTKNTKNHLNTGACAHLQLCRRLRLNIHTCKVKQIYTGQPREYTTFSSVPSKWKSSTPIPLLLSLSAWKLQLRWSNTKQ